MEKAAEKVRSGNFIPDCYDMNCEQMRSLIFKITQGEDFNVTWAAIATAFRYGFYQGNHCTINRKLKKL